MRRYIVLLVLAMLMTAFSAVNVFAVVATFTHTDDNPNSPRRTQSVGPYDATNNNTVTMWYHQYNRY